MHTTDLGGHSGCQILLCETEENLVFVRKISSNIEYNQRLIKQAEKQSLFNTPSIKTPKVLDRGYTKDGLFYFDMEYVQGITLAEYLKRIEVGKVRGLVEQIVNGINSLIVALGAPKQEKFIYHNRKELNVPLSLGLGASLDFEAGNVKRAPRWMSNCGLEWLYRIIQEPKRMFKRYFVDAVKIVPMIWKYRKEDI